jgi:ABC-type multidrug transport system fused ATPase/permease subunit
MSVITKISDLLSPSERRRAKLVFVLMLGMALLEAVGVASVMPFVAVLTDAEQVTRTPLLAMLYDRLGFINPHSFLVFLGTVVLALFVASLAFKVLTTYAINRFSNMRLHSIASRLLAAYLRQPYEFFLTRNTADLGKTILSEVRIVTDGVLVAGLRAAAAVAVAATLLLLLLALEPALSVIVFVVLGSAYGFFYLLTRRYLKRIGRARVDANKRRFVLANEALNGIKELRLLGREGAYLERFNGPSRAFAHYQATRKAISDLPFYFVQIIAFGGVIVMVLFLLGRHGGIEGALPVISLYAFAGYRLLPTFQDIFRSVTEITFAMPALDALHADLTYRERRATNDETAPARPLALHSSIRFERVSYRYPETERAAVEDLDFTIVAGACVAFVGSTGAGKSTTMDLLLGLLEPSQGRILIDGLPLEGPRLVAWQRNLGYVPQQVFLTDDTVRANIAFGVPKGEIDQAAVERAARAAHIHDFVVDELELGYETMVGERGIRLSGGQKQRLAIARALYSDSGVIVFDEATSALDNATEAAVMEAIAELRGHKTVILIAHRLSTVRHCDTLFLLQDRRLVAQGTMDELGHTNAEFARLTHADASANIHVMKPAERALTR